MNNAWQRHWIMAGTGFIALAWMVSSGLWPGPERQAVALEDRTFDATNERIAPSALLPFAHPHPATSPRPPRKQSPRAGVPWKTSAPAAP